jgi:ribosome assembly protein YihI (activator of Der GTPase)
VVCDGSVARGGQAEARVLSLKGGILPLRGEHWTAELLDVHGRSAMSALRRERQFRSRRRRRGDRPGSMRLFVSFPGSNSGRRRQNKISFADPRVGQRKAIAIAVRNVSGRRRWSKLDDYRLGASRAPPIASIAS